jgi:hypothetical protein
VRSKSGLAIYQISRILALPLYTPVLYGPELSEYTGFSPRNRI